MLRPLLGHARNPKPLTLNQPPTTNPQPPTQQLDNERLAAALEKQRRHQASAPEVDERKRKFNSLAANEEDVTEEDMEAFRMVKGRAEDPLQQFKRNGGGGGGYDLLE